MFGERGKFIKRTGTMTVDTAGTGVLDAVSDRAVVDVTDLFQVVFLMTAVAPSTTVTAVFELSYDGVGWSTAGANATITNFATATAQYPLPQSDTHGMPLPLSAGRVTLTVFTGVGSYTFGAVGYQRMGYA